MKLILPENIFTRLIADNLPPQLKSEVLFSASSLITNTIKNSSSAVGLIPTLDLIKNNSLFISKSFGLSFEGSLCNSYIYYSPVQKEVKEIILFGDVSSVEVLLCKILFQEMYDSEVEVKISTNEKHLEGHNFLITGDKNFIRDKYLNGISFAEEMIETLSLPFVNYVFASKDVSLIEELNEQLKGVSNSIYDEAEGTKFGDEFSDGVKNYIRENISSFVMDFDKHDLEGINQIIRLPYYHGIIDDIFEINFV